MDTKQIGLMHRQQGKALASAAVGLGLLAVAAGGGYYYLQQQANTLAKQQAESAITGFNQRFAGQMQLAYVSAGAELASRSGTLEQLSLQDAEGKTVARIDQVVLGGFSSEQVPQTITLHNINGTIPEGELAGKAWSVDTMTLDNAQALWGAAFPAQLTLSLQQLKLPQPDDLEQPLPATDLTYRLDHDSATQQVTLTMNTAAKQYGDWHVALGLDRIQFHPEAMSLLRKALDSGNFYALQQAVIEPEYASIAHLETSVLDDGVVDKILTAYGEEQGISADEARAAVLASLDELMQEVGVMLPILREAIIELKSFVRHPGKLSASVSPDPAIPLSTLAVLANGNAKQAEQQLMMLAMSNLLGGDLNIAVKAEPKATP